MLAALQRGIPLSRRPFADMARDLGCRESDLISIVERCREEGKLRRFGAVFDTRRLGYRSALCCANVENADEAAALLVPRREVTHCYLREAPGCPNLWWTWSAPAAVFDKSVSAVGLPFRMLCATRRYKIDVVFGADSIRRDESTSDDLPPPDEAARRVIRALQDDTEVRSDYFAGVAEKIGMKEWDLLSLLEIWRRNGRLRRIGMLLDHRKSGFTVNGMCCFRIDGDTTAAGRLLASSRHVTHCYERPGFPGFQYNLYAMIHCSSRAEADGRFAELAGSLRRESIDPGNPVMLVSTREYKKTSMRFFV